MSEVMDYHSRLSDPASRKFETFSYLPAMDATNIRKQVEYLVKKGVDCAQFKERVLALLDARGAKYPAEHNVGHIYRAGPVLEGFYRSLDPTNTFNPGIGQTSTRHRWRAVCCDVHREPPGR